MALRKTLAALLCALLLSPPAPAQHASSPAAEEAAQPKVTITQAPPETPEQFSARKLALQEMLQRLTTTGRIMQVVAHPDDEDGAMLTLESRVKGNTAELFTFTRGEGGQNAQGAVFFDELGLLRTLELLAADKEYGAEERFSHLADFGFSKTADETYQKWGGRDVPLKDLVEAVRAFQPDVLVARFSGTQKDGHGHHQASAQLTVQAFHDAADAKRFPQAGEAVWQASKLYTGLAGDAATLVPDEAQPSPLLGGKTPQEIAIAGLRHQESQGAGNWKGPIPKIYSSYKLIETALGIRKPEQESDFFEGIDTSLVGLANRFPEEAKRKPNLRAGLNRAAQDFDQARIAAGASPEAALIPLARAISELVPFGAAVCGGVCITDSLELRIKEKLMQADEAMHLAAGLDSSLDRIDAKTPFASPGDSLRFRFQIRNRSSKPIRLGEPSGGLLSSRQGLPSTVPPYSQATLDFQYKVPGHEDPTRMPIHRDSQVRDAAYKIDEDSPFLPDRLPPLPWCVDLPTEIAGRTLDLASCAEGFLAPPVSVQQSPVAVLKRLDQPHQVKLHVILKNNSQHALNGIAAFLLPAGWSATPTESKISVEAGDAQDLTFTLQWRQSQNPSQSTIRAVFTSGAKRYFESYHLLSRPDLPDAFPYYAPAQTLISLIDADISTKHNIGYIMGAGDTIPDNLASLGFTVHLLTPEDLASADLSTYDTIVTGVRAYGSRPDLREHNQRLLDYVKNGGTMVVQYEQDIDGFNKGNYTPYPATMGRERVSQEEQPVTILDPGSTIFNYPNHISAADFDGWVQERGLYYMKDWSPQYSPLLQMSDAGEKPLRGGLLVAHYGKGTYITTALAFYRELPNGVPGATRLFINLLGAGHGPTN